MARLAALTVTALLAAGLYLGWAGFRLGPLEWAGAAAVLGGTWLWDLRWPLLSAYVAAALWLAERLAARLGRR